MPKDGVERLSSDTQDALTHLAAQAKTLPEPYLVAGPQAAFVYHLWLQPIAKMIDVCVPKETQADWRAALPPSWTILTQAPGLNQARQATHILILDATLTEKRWQRRVIHRGLAFTSPEDVYIDLLRDSKTQIGLSEVAALLIKQKDTLDWRYLFDVTSSTWLGHRLVEIVRTINHKAGYPLLTMPYVKPHITPPPNITSIHPDSVKEILRPLFLETANAQPA